MKKLVFEGLFFISTVVAFLFSGNSVLARISILPPEAEPAFFGQDHFYSVNFRGNGEAVVTAKINFRNDQETSLSSLSFRVPRVEPKDVSAFQVIREGICSRYQPAELKVVYTPPICLEYQEPDYFQSFYRNDKYQKAKTILNVDTLEVSLPQSIKPGASGSLIFSFRAFGYAKKNLFAAYDFTFETAKTESRIRSLSVGISTDSDIFLRGGKGKVDYRIEEGVAALKTAELAAPIADARLSTFVAQIGQGEIYKAANNLLPLDSYLVKGSFADSRLKLYAKEILLVVAVVSLVIYLVYRLVKKLFSVVKMVTAKSPVAVDLLLVFGGSFIASFLIVAYTLLLVFGRGYIYSVLPYNVSGLIYILVILVSIGIYGLLLLFPALISGFRKGIFWGLAAFSLTILWLIVGGVAVFLVFFSTGIRIYPPYPITPMTRSISEPVNLDSGQSGSTFEK